MRRAARGVRGVLRRVGLEASTGVAPLVDVVLLLLLFLVLTARIVPREQQLSVDLPAAGAASAARYLEPLRVRLDLEGEGLRIQAGPHRLTELAALGRLAASLPADTPVLLDAGDAVPYERVIAAYDAVVEGGLRRVHLAPVPAAEAP